MAVNWRWAVPGGVAVLAAGMVAAPALAGAGTPNLPKLTAAQLLASVSAAKVPGLSGKISETAALGLPDLSVVGSSLTGSGASPQSLLSGTHTLRVWSRGTDQQRIEIDASQAEYDVVRTGSTLVTYDSSTDTVTTTPLTRPSGTRAGSAAEPAQPTGSPDAAAGTEPKVAGIPGLAAARTPQQAATAVLAAIDPTTAVSVARTVSVASRDAYSLDIVPRSAASLVGSVRIAIDAATKIPLQLEVTARGASAPALRIGFDRVSFTAPPESVFTLPTGHGVPQSLKQAAAAHATKEAARSGHDGAPTGTAGAATALSQLHLTGVTVLGSGWTSVVTAKGLVLPASEQRLLSSLAQPVTVAGVPGHVLHTALLTALLLDDGRVYVGAVTAQTLTDYAAG